MSRDGHVIRHRKNLLPSVPDSLSLAAVDLLGRAVESNGVRDVQSGDLPRVLQLEPWVGSLQLLSVGREELLDQREDRHQLVRPAQERVPSM